MATTWDRKGLRAALAAARGCHNARALHLAYGLLRGREYRRLEYTTRHAPSALPYDVAAAAQAHDPAGGWTLERVKAWMAQGPSTDLVVRMERARAQAAVRRAEARLAHLRPTPATAAAPR